MRILLVSFFYEHDFGGAELVARRSRELLLAVDCTVDVLCLAGGRSLGDKGFYRLPVPVWRRLGEQWFKRSILFLPGPGLDRYLFAKAKKQIDLSRYDGVFCPDFNAIVLASGLARAAGCPMVLWLQENLPRRLDQLNISTIAAPLIQRLLKKREPEWRQAIGDFDAVACVSDFTRDQGMAFAAGGSQFSTLYPPLDEVFEKVKPSPARCEGPARLLFLGRLSMEKGVDLLIDAHTQMHEDATLTLAGLEGPLADEARSAARRDDRVRLLPPVSPSERVHPSQVHADRQPACQSGHPRQPSGAHPLALPRAVAYPGTYHLKPDRVNPPASSHGVPTPNYVDRPSDDQPRRPSEDSVAS